MRWTSLLVLCGCLISPVMHFGSGSTPEQAQQARLTKLMPAQLSTDAKYTGEVRTAKIRVWADDDYRAQNVHWQKTFGDLLADANEVLAPVFGVRLEAEYHDWDHHAPGNTLPDDIAELQRLDAGDGVLSVVGLTSALGLVSANFELLGLGSLPGRYIVMRGFADRQEREAFAAAFHDLPADERDNVVEARRRHKVVAILLHELGHNLGAPHEDGETIMNPTYSHHASEFSDAARATMQATLDQRLGRAAIVREVPKRELPRHPSLVVAVTAAGETFVGGRLVDADTLGELFKVSFADDPETQVVIEADRAAAHGVIVQIMERAKAAGLTRLAIGTASN